MTPAASRNVTVRCNPDIRAYRGDMTERTITGGPATPCLSRKEAVQALYDTATTLRRMGLVSLGYAVVLRRYGQGWAVFVTQPADSGMAQVA